MGKHGSSALESMQQRSSQTVGSRPCALTNLPRHACSSRHLCARAAARAREWPQRGEKGGARVGARVVRARARHARRTRARATTARALNPSRSLFVEWVAPAMADDRLYNVGAAIERELLAKWGGPILGLAPELAGA